MLLVVVAGGVSLLPDAGAGLAYQRDLIAAGELWRAITGHFVHWSHDHLVWDAGTFVALGVACELRSRKRFLVCVVASAIAIPAVVWLLLPELELYAGLSGIDSALFGLLGAGLVREQWERGNWAALVIAGVFCLAFVLKTGFEMTNGGTVFVGDLAPGIVSVPLAHLAGALAGVTAAVLPIGRPSDRSRVSSKGSCRARLRRAQGGSMPPESKTRCTSHATRPLPARDPLSRLAERTLAELDESSRRADTPTRGERLLRGLELAKQWVVRKLRELFQEHWDIGLFDLAFGSVKAFGVYPALYFAGLAWTIPVMEYAPLNTQLWTAGYLFARGQILSQLGRRRYGHTLNRLDEFRDRALRIQPRDARSIHRFALDSGERCVRVRRSRFRAWLDRLRGRPPEPNVLLQSELRALISDQEFLFRANPLRSNAYLYEEVLLRKILSAPGDRRKLLARLQPEAPLQGERRQLLGVIGETTSPTRARVIEQGERLAAALRQQLGSGFSAAALALRWIHWSHRCRIYRKLAELEVLEYQLLADLLEGEMVERSRQLAPIRWKRAEIEALIDRGAGFVERARGVTSRAKSRQLIDDAIAEAERTGLSVRLARAARWLSYGAPAARQPEPGLAVWWGDR